MGPNILTRRSDRLLVQLEAQDVQRCPASPCRTSRSSSSGKARRRTCAATSRSRSRSSRPGYFGFYGSIVRRRPTGTSPAWARATRAAPERQFPRPRHRRARADPGSAQLRGHQLARLEPRQPAGVRVVRIASLNRRPASTSTTSSGRATRRPGTRWATATTRRRRRTRSAVITSTSDMLTYNGLPAAAAAGADPVGNIEILRRVPEGVRLQGWTVDPSKSNPTAGRRLRERLRLRAD